MTNTTINTESAKMTYVSALDFVLKNYEMPAEVADKLTALRDQTEKRNNKPSKPTKTQEANIEIQNVILGALSKDKPQTITEVQANCEALANFSNQKLSALFKKLVDSNQIVKTIEKRKSYFALA